MFEAGRALGEKDLSLREVVGQAAIGGAYGAVGGAVIAPVVSLATLSVKGAARATSRSFKNIQNKLSPVNRTKALEDLTQATLNSFEDKVPVMDKLRRLEQQLGVQDEVGMLREVVNEGYIPKIRGGLLGRGTADYQGHVLDARSRQKTISNAVTALAQRSKAKTSLASLKVAAKKTLIGRTDIDPQRAGKQIDAIINNLQKEFKTQTLSAKQVDMIRRRTGKETKAFWGDQFVADAQDALRRVSRLRLDQIDTRITQLNAESAKLMR